jgi:hypothetical protein
MEIMKKFFKSSTLYLSILFLLNAAVLVALCFTTFSNIDNGTEFAPSIDISAVEPTTMTRYLIGRKDFNVYKNFGGTLTDGSNMYSTILVDDANIEVGQEVAKDDIVGTYNGEETKAEYDSFCIEINTVLSHKEILLYNYNKFTISIDLAPRDYYEYQFQNTEKVYVHANDKYYKATFRGYNYDNYVATNTITAYFITEHCNELISFNSSLSIEILTENYTNQTYVSSEVFDNNLAYKLFYVENNEMLINIYVESFAIVDNYALIRSNDFTLDSGMYLYLYE